MGANPQKHFIVLKYLYLQADYNNKYPNGGWSWAYKSVFQSNNVIPQRIQLGIQMRGNILFIYRYVLLPLGNVEINTPAMGCSLSQSCLKELCVGGEVRRVALGCSLPVEKCYEDKNPHENQPDKFSA